MDASLVDTLTAWRRHLHAHPGLSLHEGETAGFVVEKLKQLGVEEIAEGIGGHGVVATLRRDGNRSVGLRADMDALPIEEATEDLPWRSRNSGVMHACGHDGHTVALLGAAALLKNDPDWSGTVHLVFQPAEEGAGGAKSMIKDGLFQRFPMERIFGWHNWPGLPAGTIAVHDGPVMAAGARFDIHFDGHGGHAALPHLTRDPVIAAGHAIVAVQSVISRNLDPVAGGGVVSITKMEAGTAMNQVPASAVLRGTARWLRQEDGDIIESALQRIVQGIGATFDVAGQLEFRRIIPPTINHAAEADLAAAAAAAGGALRRDVPPAMTGEDFSCFLNEVPGAFVWIGNGPTDGGRELHSPHYDFNDAILPRASGYLVEVAKRALVAG
ncbi:amidohydrolase [Methylocella sp. CPCC 101449]|nr:amidohydrolase [Methylocella sp. CPCC 101449]